MKRICLVFAAALLSFLVADARTVKKTYDIDDFTGIRITNAFEVVLEHSDTYKVEIEISEEFLPFLLVKNRGGILELNFTKLPFDLKQKNRTKDVRAVISMPELTFIEMSGASKLICNDQFTNAMDKISIDLSGGSLIKNLNLKSPEVVIELSGASKATMSVRAGDVDVNLKGSSRLELDGEASELDIKATGSSRVNGAGFVAEDAEVNASGASSVEIGVTRVLTAEISGGSKCRYHGDEDNLTVKAEKISGASSLKHVK